MAGGGNMTFIADRTVSQIKPNEDGDFKQEPRPLSGFDLEYGYVLPGGTGDGKKPPSFLRKLTELMGYSYQYDALSIAIQKIIPSGEKNRSSLMVWTKLGQEEPQEM